MVQTRKTPCGSKSVHAIVAKRWCTNRWLIQPSLDIQLDRVPPITALVCHPLHKPLPSRPMMNHFPTLPTTNNLLEDPRDAR
ncbi:MAG: hypothetical protein CBB71_16085 [Rhodopirellula sp. TMED11]|uniref:hypothetical protein n=1 Tax=Stieleria bergensis TaxID=2528025 RepID=UPI000B6B2410|nr:MAG: hypothetical protein CBB71_16085 [Rhodopirellula sp. TMED11]